MNGQAETDRGKGFDDVETSGKTSIVTEHRVVAGVPIADGNFAEVKTEWDRRTGFVKLTAEALKEKGCGVQIESRRLVETVEISEVPE